jgi:hypothetical protein
MRGLLRVSIGLETTSEEIAALEQIFTSVDLHVLVDPEIARFSADSPWVMYLSAPLESFASQFVGMPEGGAAGEAWPGLKTFIERVSEAFQGRGGSVVFTDGESEVMIALSPDLPEDAYAELLELDLLKIEGQRVSWDPEQRGWYSLRGDPCPRRD